MLAIRMQRTGRKGHAMFRVVVQDAQRTPTSGKIVARLGSYDPHAKSVTLDKEKASFYLKHGAQPSGRVAVLLKSEGVKLPEWVKLPTKNEGKVRNPDKRRSTRPDEPAPKEPAAEETSTEGAETEPVAESTEAEQAQIETKDTETQTAEDSTPADEKKSDEKSPKTVEGPSAQPEAPPEDTEASAENEDADQANSNKDAQETKS